MDNIGIIILIIAAVVIFLFFRYKSNKNSYSGSTQSTLQNNLSSIASLEKSAEAALARGDSEPSFLLGNTFNDADDVPKNPPYNNCKQNFSKAVYWLQKAADANHADAMVVLGCKYFEGGDGVERDVDKGKKLLCKAKSIGTTPAGMADIVIRQYGINCN